RAENAKSLAGTYQRGSRRDACRLLVLADDPELERRDDAGREAHRHLVLAERLHRLLELDPAMVDLDVRLLQLLRDVAAGDRAEQLLVLADHALELERHAVDAVRELVRRGALLLDLAGDDGALVLEAVLVGNRRGDREATRHEVVAAVARANRDDLAGLAEVLDVLREDNLHHD